MYWLFFKLQKICDAYNRSVFKEDMLEDIAACKEYYSMDVCAHRGCIN